MNFKLKINCDNAAFDDLGAELVRILKDEVSPRVLKDTEWKPEPLTLRHKPQPIMDLNGNKVGECWFEEEEREVFDI